MENNRNRTRSIVEAGIISGIVVVLALINAYLQVFSFIGVFITPIPITILYLRHNFKVSLGAIISSGVIVAILYQPLVAIPTAIIYGLTGVALGYCIKKQLKMSKILAVMTIVSLIGTLVSLVFYAFIITQEGFMGLVKEQLKIIHDSLENTKQMSISLGQSTEIIDLLIKTYTDKYLMMVMPAMMIIACFMLGFFNYFITKTVLKKLKYNIKETGSFKMFYINNRIVAVLTIVGLIGLILNMKKVAVGEYIYNTALIIGQFACVFDGIALIIYYLREKYRLNKGLVVIIIIFTIFNPYLGAAYIFLGLADAIMDFRKLDPDRLFKKINR